MRYDSNASYGSLISKKQGLSQEKLAELTNFSLAHISHIETANTKLSLPALINIASALNTTADSLLCDSLHHARDTLSSQISELMADCDEVELRIIRDTILALKTSLKKNPRPSSDGEPFCSTSSNPSKIHLTIALPRFPCDSAKIFLCRRGEASDNRWRSYISHLVELAKIERKLLRS